MSVPAHDLRIFGPQGTLSGRPRRGAMSWLPILALAIGLAACDTPSVAPPPAAKIPVTSEVVGRTDFAAKLTLLGRVEPSSRLELTTRDAGTVRYPGRFRDGLRTGELVRSGELLFEIDNRGVRLALVEAELAAEGAKAELERARRGVAGGFLPEVEVKRREIEMGLADERLASARHRAERLRHHATATGVLTIDTVLAPGSEVTAGTVLGHLALEGAPRLEAWASAADLGEIRPGLVVECRLPGGREPVGRGVVREVAQQVDSQGTARVVAEIDDDVAIPLPGQGVEIDVLLEPLPDALTIPLEAIVLEGPTQRVFVLETSGADLKAAVRQLQVSRFRGGRDGDRVAVLDGLIEGERVAVRGAELLADGQLAIEAQDETARTGGPR